MNEKVFSIKTLIIIVGAIALLTAGLLPRVLASNTATAYCVDQNGSPSSSFAGGGVLVLDGSGNRLLFANDQQIAAADTSSSHPAPITSDRLYTLYRQPDGGFELDSNRPEITGKTVLGAWTADCSPVVNTP